MTCQSTSKLPCLRDSSIAFVTRFVETVGEGDCGDRLGRPVLVPVHRLEFVDPRFEPAVVEDPDRFVPERMESRTAPVGKLLGDRPFDRVVGVVGRREVQRVESRIVVCI